MVKKTYPFIIVTFFTILCGFSLLHNGLLPTHDGEYHVIRFYEFDKVLRSGVLYPRWAPDFNNRYGVPLFNFVYPLPNYISSLLHLLGFSFISTFKLNMLLASILGGVFFYLWAKIFWGEWGGIVSSIFYTFSPYHILNIYVRGSVGEVWSLGLFPVFLWAITKVIYENELRYILISSISLSLIIFSHNILALMFFPFAISYSILILLQEGYSNKKLCKILFIFFTSLCISAVFWFPALFEKQLTVGLQIYDIHTFFADFYQLFFPSWGSGTFNDANNPMSVQIGVANLCIIVFILLLSPWIVKKNKKERSTVIFFLFSFFLIFFLMIKQSSYLWNVIPLLNYVQFPWRLLSVEIVITSFLSGSLLSFLKKKIIAVIAIICCFLLTFQYTKPPFYYNRSDTYYTSRANFISGTNSPGNAFNTIWFSIPKNSTSDEVKISNAKGEIRNQKRTAISDSFSVILKKKATILIHRAYFPGWKAIVDGKINPVFFDSNGILNLNLTKGEHNVKIYYEETNVEIIGRNAFLFGLLLLFLMYYYFWFAKIKR